MLVNITGRWAN